MDLDNSLIAPCGMNCGICMAYLRDKNKCHGCLQPSVNKKKTRVLCVIKNCELLAKTSSKFCYECEKFPCKRLIQIDKRYRTKYNMSMIENLSIIKNAGLDTFFQIEKEKWDCKNCGGTICVHRGYCLHCKDTTHKNVIKSK
jgi:hypothetical protein